MVLQSETCPSGVLCISYPLVIFILFIVILFLYYFSDKYFNTSRFDSRVKPSKESVAPIKIYIEKSGTINHSQFIDEHPPLGPPTRRVNMRTRGPLPDTQQVGILTSESVSDGVIPLYGRPSYMGSSRWNYFTSDDKFNQMKLPVEFKRRNCMKDECDEVMDDDRMHVPTLGKSSEYKVTLYPLDAPKYIPYIV